LAEIDEVPTLAIAILRDLADSDSGLSRLRQPIITNRIDSVLLKLKMPLEGLSEQNVSKLVSA
jgi:hypothetical protein